MSRSIELSCGLDDLICDLTRNLKDQVEEEEGDVRVEGRLGS